MSFNVSSSQSTDKLLPPLSHYLITTIKKKLSTFFSEYSLSILHNIHHLYNFNPPLIFYHHYHHLWKNHNHTWLFYSWSNWQRYDTRKTYRLHISFENTFCRIRKKLSFITLLPLGETLNGELISSTSTLSLSPFSSSFFWCYCCCPYLHCCQPYW